MAMMPVIKQNLSDNIKHDLKKYILDMDLKESAKLPPEVEIGRKFGVSRVTVRRALDELEQENLIFRIHGRGTFVNPEAAAIKISLNPAQEFGHLIELGGYEAQIKLISQETINRGAMDQGTVNQGTMAQGASHRMKKHCRNLQVEEGARLYRIEKVYYADGHPAIVCIDYMPRELFQQEPSEDEWSSMSSFELLRRYAGRLLCRDRVEILTMTREEMGSVTDSALLMECQSVLELDNLAYDQDNQPVISANAFFDTKYIRYNLLRSQEHY
ncbi:GntR family transcriptional regulator [Lachnoclostridium pacaense]|uniref:GntR family transcriptional regulator n=1 Tax=Enterocloster hominis (ex Hitch et al. 2024) TaxID=1917870 RepID=UPI001D0F6583|nr:GntR family transcriptional regulator [Lachnoclostridium pacaense]MCC2878856.1 GntR family transcriptional regulator [Lachnoclostridium pacaense]